MKRTKLLNCPGGAKLISAGSHGVIMRSTIFMFFSISWMLSFGQTFNTNGNASYLGGLCYELTPDVAGVSGSIFSNNTINLNEPFVIEAMMNFGTKDPTGADGIV